MITKEYCTGCGACALSCPKHCISMLENKIGEVSPAIDEKICIGCGFCEKICPQNQKPPMNYPIKCYVGWSKKESDWIFSASGGVGAVLARWSINNDIVAYGCDYSEKGDLSHFRICGETDVERVQSSKYSQSTAFGVYEELKTYLSEDRRVLFIGTPCQIAGLKKYLKKDYSNLITVDLVCHGTPPNTYLKQHLKSKGFSNSIEKIRFRGEFDQKLSIWRCKKIEYSKGNQEDLYFKAFYANMISRNSCYFCHYAKAERCSDITIGDFWGLGTLNEIKRFSNRPSLILINSSKGAEFISEVSDELYLEERPILEAVRGNGRLNRPPYLSVNAKAFQCLYPLTGFELGARIAPILGKVYLGVKRMINGLRSKI